MRHFLIKNTKVVFLFSVVFLSLVFANYFINYSILKSTIHDLQAQSIKGTANRINAWLETKINAVVLSETLINLYDNASDEERIHEILLNNATMASFSSMFIGYTTNHIISSRYWQKPLFYSLQSQYWYQKTLENRDITISELYQDEELKETAVSVCYPSQKNNQINGVICGVLTLEYIKTEILNIVLPYEGRAFIVDDKKQILIQKDDEDIVNLLAYKFNESWDMITDTDEKYFLSYVYLPKLKWYLVVQLEKKNVYSKIDFLLLINLLIYATGLISFVCLNIFYNYKDYQSTKKLMNAQAMIHMFIDNNEKGFLVADSDLNITYCNQQFLNIVQCKDFSLQNNEILLSCESFLFSGLPVTIKERIEKMLNITIKYKKTISKTLVMNSSELKHLSCIVSPILDHDKHYYGLVIALEDITNAEDEKRIQKEHESILVQQAKMADLGNMIGAISHQWKQPLNATSIMLGNVLQFQEMGRLNDAILKENLTHALVNIHYLSSTIDTFKNFYKPSKRVQKFDVKEAIEETIFIINPHFKNTGIEITIQTNATTLPITTYKNELQQILVNLIINAKEALLGASNQPLKNIKVFIESTCLEYRIIVEDNGCGIRKDFQTKLFEPFMTTKGLIGTGNGLYISLLIAKKKLQGDLTIVSFASPTRFLLTIPKEIKVAEND